jgi:hypothetical protein
MREIVEIKSRKKKKENIYSGRANTVIIISAENKKKTIIVTTSKPTSAFLLNAITLISSPNRAYTVHKLIIIEKIYDYNIKFKRGYLWFILFSSSSASLNILASYTGFSAFALLLLFYIVLS